MIRAAFFVFLLTLTVPAVAQVSEPDAESAYSPSQEGQPNIPGTFVLEFGINNALEAPDKFDLALWGSRTVNIYYTYELRLGQSKFSVVPGIGLSLERFKFKNGATLGYDAEDSLKLLLPQETTLGGERKSQLITNYVDVPLELRFTTNPDERNARARVQAIRPNWPMAVVVAWLAERYPRGLTAQGLTEIDESELLQLRAA